MSSIGQYLKETRSELNYVAWPTRNQTIIYTVLVAAISIGVAVYLGLFDYIFTTALTHVAGVIPAAQSGVQVTQTPVPVTSVTPTFNLSSTTTQ